MSPKLKPCKDCPDRSIEPNCHTTCEKYLAQVKEYEIIKNEKSKESDFNEFKKDMVTKMKKRYKK